MENIRKSLTASESEEYMTVVLHGNIDDMFDFAYSLGWKKAMEHVLEESKKFAQGFGYKK